MLPGEVVASANMLPTTHPLKYGPVLCIGEALWDILPTGEFLGGAPLNVAGHLSRLNVPAALLSRVGNDERGRRALDQIARLGVDVSIIQVDPDLPTGEARVVLDSAGSASYEFLRPAAWDRIDATKAALAMAQAASATVFGTLTQREIASRATVRRLTDASRWRIFDVNLRAPYDDREAVLASLETAHLVKLNEQEVAVLAGWLGVANEVGSVQQVLSRKFGTRTLCVTRGEGGATCGTTGAGSTKARFRRGSSIPLALAIHSSRC